MDSNDDGNNDDGTGQEQLSGPNDIAQFINEHVGERSIPKIKEMMTKVGKPNHPVTQNRDDMHALANARKIDAPDVNFVHSLMPKKGEVARVRDVALATILSILIFDKLSRKGRTSAQEKQIIMEYYHNRRKPIDYQRVQNFDDEYNEAFNSYEPNKVPSTENYKIVHVVVYVAGNYKTKSDWIDHLKTELNVNINQTVSNTASSAFAKLMQSIGGEMTSLGHHGADHVPKTGWKFRDNNVIVIFHVQKLPQRYSSNVNAFIDFANDNKSDVFVLVFGDRKEINSYVGNASLPRNVITTLIFGSGKYEQLKGKIKDIVAAQS